MFGSVHLSVNALIPELFFYLRGVVDIGTWHSKMSSETQVSYTLKKHCKAFISRSIQNGWVFKIVVISTGSAIAVDHAFNLG